MANVSFLRGTQSALNKITTAQDGVFYLTTDTHRLYVGQGTELVDLNKYIKTVATQSDLDIPTADNVGDFYYVKDSNLLVIAQQTKAATDTEEAEYGYVLINKNTDTTVESEKFAATATDTVATITHTTTQTGGKETTSTFNIEAGTGLSVEATEDGKGIIINGVTYGLDITSTKVEGAEEGSTAMSSIAVQLVDDEGNGVGEVLTLKPGQNVTLQESDGVVTISSSYIDTHVTEDSGSTLTWETTKDDEGNDVKTGKITMTIKNNDGSEIPVTLTEPIVYYVGGNSYVPYSELPVYSKAEIDSKLNGLDAMTYKGTASAANPLPTQNIKIGDTYLVTETIVYDGTSYAYNGDLLIATGEEDPDTGYIIQIVEDEAVGVEVAQVTWSYVPAGDDAKIDTQYVFSVDPATNTIKLLTSGGSESGVHTLQSGDMISVTSTYGDGDDTKTLITTIAHNKVTVTKPDTPNVVGDVKTLTHITSITVDEWGHITGYDINTSTLLTYLLSGCTVTAENDVATITATLKDSAGAEKGTATHTVGSTSLKIQADATNGYTINLVWGSFETT